MVKILVGSSIVELEYKVERWLRKNEEDIRFMSMSSFKEKIACIVVTKDINSR